LLVRLEGPSPELLPFRTQLHGSSTRRADALCELADAMLTADAVASPPNVSPEPGHRRGWGSVYAALAHGRIDAAASRRAICPTPGRYSPWTSAPGNAETPKPT
jgi:hypothetical protein